MSLLTLTLAGSTGDHRMERRTEDPPARAPVRVVATLPVYASIAQAIGGSEVSVSSIADPREDAHFVRPKPSYAAEIRRADMFITTGLDLELWVPALLDRAGNRNVSEGGTGYVTTYTGVKLLEVPTSTDRSAGDIHVYGNPHVFTDPLNALIVVRNITAGLKKVAPDRSASWDRGLAAFTDLLYRRLYGDELVSIVGGSALADLSRSGNLMTFMRENAYEGKPLHDRLGGWLRAAEPFRGRDVICYHKNWAYFEDRFQVHCAEFVEAKPGIPPTPGHVARLIDLMKTRRINVIMAADYFGREKVQTVADRAGARAVMMPLQTGGDASIGTYFDLVDRWVNGLATAFRS
jgi:ABC-type Zn uptake system ZnuABC Zn-binding protein ZnuA